MMMKTVMMHKRLYDLIFAENHSKCLITFITFTKRLEERYMNNQYADPLSF